MLEEHRVIEESYVLFMKWNLSSEDLCMLLVCFEKPRQHMNQEQPGEIVL